MSVHPVNLAQLTDEVRANRAASREPLTRERAREWLVSEMERIESAEMDRAVLYDLVIEYDNGEQLLGALADLLVDAANGRIK